VECRWWPRRFHVTQISFESDSRLRQIDGYAFCESPLASIIIPKPVLAVPPYCFSGCTRLQSVLFESDCKLAEILDYVFSSCPLTVIMISRSVTRIGLRGFEKCSRFESVRFERGSQLTEISSFAFCQCPLKSILLPNSLGVISPDAFWSTRPMLLEIEPGSETLCAVDSKLYTIDRKRFLRFYGGWAIIPKSTTVLGPYCFAGVRWIGPVTFDSDSELTKIGGHAFYDSSVTDVCIPKSPTVLPNCCFYFCRSLNSVTFEPESNM
jgi:hypothetical protein